jgi:hypothetical protein
LLFLAGCWLSPAQTANPLLWQIGAPDGDDREFALAPDQYSRIREDGFFVVGRSDAKRDWPYAHPGPVDGWGGSRPRTFSVVFGLQQVPAAGECVFRLRTTDAHSSSPPVLGISINGHETKHALPPGAGDHTIFGQSNKGKPREIVVTFPAERLRAGANEVAITTLSGSWFLYDWAGLETPPGATLGPVTGTILSSLGAPPVLVEREGKLMQTIQVAIRHLGNEEAGRLRVEGAPDTPLRLSATSQQFEIAVPAVEKEQMVGVSLEVAGRVAASRSITLKPVRKWTVYLLPHSHVDIGYTHVQTEVEQAQWRYLEMAMEASRKSAGNPAGSQFKWNVEVLWAVDSYLKQASPEKQRAFFEAVKAGWVGLDALYGNELTGLCRPEELLRLVSLGAQLAERSGVPVESAMITDVPGYTWGIVPTFAHAGVKYFSIGPNGGDRIGHTIAAWGDKPFWWIGPNGRDKVLVWMTGTGYYQVFRSPQVLQDYLQGLEARGYPYDMVHVRHCLGDNGAPDVHFADTVKQWNATYAYPKLVIATTGEMFRDFEQRHGSKLPVARGDFTPYWEDGAASSARETALNRASADRLTQAETLLALRNPDGYQAGDFWQAWRNVVLYDEHTWGAHNSISQPDEPFVKSQWAIKQAFALQADEQSRKLLDAALGPGQAAGTPWEAVDVFNTTDWKRTDLVELPLGVKVTGDVVRTESGRTVPSQRLADGRLAFLAGDVPSFGSRRFFFATGTPGSTGKARADKVSLSTPSLRVLLDETTGAITSLRHGKAGAELVDRTAGTALNDYFYLPGSDLKGLKRSVTTRIQVREAGPLVASLLVESEAPGCAALTREVRVIDGLERVDIVNVVDKRAVRAKEGVHFGFGFNVPGGVMRMDVPWGIVRPELDQIPGACKNWFTVQRWVDVSNERYGITWATPDAPLVQVGGITANLIGSLSDPKAWLDHLEPSQTLYSWVMNNHWHTNYRAEQEGPTVFRFSLWPHGPFRPGEAARFGLSQSQPLLVAPAVGAKTPAPRLKIESPGVLVTALKPSEDGNAYILRLFGVSGKPEKAKIRWANPKPKSVWLSDLTEAPRAKVTSEVTVPAYGIVTLRAERAN